MNTTGIEWAGLSWNTLSGCTPVSPGCRLCYAAAMARRLQAMDAPGYDALVEVKGVALPIAKQSSDGRAVFTGAVRELPERLADPLRRKKPSTIFANSMSDLFHEAVSLHHIDQVMATIAMAEQHTFIVLTKRPERMREYMLSRTAMDDSAQYERMPQWYRVATRLLDEGEKGPVGRAWERAHNRMPDPAAPLPNLWLGISAENQEWLDTRILALRQTPAATRVLSLEPLLGPIDLGAAIWPQCASSREVHDAQHEHGLYCDEEQAVDWVIVGGESGTKAQPCNPDWVRSIRDQCVAAGVPFFFKQWGEWLPSADGLNYEQAAADFRERFGRRVPIEQHSDGRTYARVGKKRAGRVLDGRTWEERP